MKKITNVSLFLISLFPVNLFAHDGHVHTGTFWENTAHFVLTNGYLVIPVLVATYFLTMHLKSKSKIKNKWLNSSCLETGFDWEE